jgi:D-alanyl-D-alanine carboxypeptidase
MNTAGFFNVKLWAGALVAAAALSFAAPAAAQDRYAAIVMDARTNEVLHEDQADEARFPASLTKMMTLYMIFEALERGDISLDTRWTASRNASRQPPSRLGLACSRPGCPARQRRRRDGGRTVGRQRSAVRRQHDGSRP